MVDLPREQGAAVDALCVRRLLFASVVVTNPFVGFSCGRKDKFGDLWDRLLAVIDAPR